MTAPAYHGEIAAKEWIERYGVRTPLRRFAEDEQAALDALQALRPPLVVKLVSPALHKSDVGGVRFGIRTADDMRGAVEAIATGARRHGVAIEGFLIEETAPDGVEVLVGGMIDAVFGPAVVVGLGGIFTEILDDVAARICPIDRDDAMQMIREIKAAPLLFGARGRAPVDVEALADVLLALGGERGLLVEHAERIQAIDLNPVIVSTSGAVAVDARVILFEEQAHVA
jgi:acetate---CoA ligase (ADP-forming) subunit beta